jgi:triacylglycerol esterase/lipase EstA (alpha/beta hydrolase family)
MADQEASDPSNKRFHIVLVPGFAGFDALGQLEYYGGLTKLFKPCRAGKEVLHYFDNFPTAAVATRATRLRNYLAKRIARGEIFTSDDVILVGHSTGGLDIRRLFCDLSELREREQPMLVEGGERVEADDLLQRVRRVVFLSVPHWGTNIADWVQAHWIWREALVEELRAAVAGSQMLVVDRFESAIANNAASLTRAGLFRAVQDALDEANENIGKPGPVRTAEAQEAASELALYLRQMASDFRAIDDLTSRPPPVSKRITRRTMSPAHFDAEDREAELKQLQNIDFRSYVTIGRRPFRFDPGRPAPQWELAKPWTYPKMCEDGGLSRRTDIVYRACYRACAGGPFEPPESGKKEARRLSPQQPIEVWDNDGIVNTLSMFWPLGKNVLVRADHMDIVGHYEPVLADPGGGRTYRSYDLLKSSSGFDEKVFCEVWNDIFAFCLGRADARQTLAAGAGRG